MSAPHGEPCPFVHQPDHMKGWECFGTTDADDAPLVRQLGYGHHAAKPKYGTEKWGPGETPGGVGSIEIHSYPTGAFIYVAGPIRAKVEAAYARARHAVIEAQEVLWP